MCPGQVRHSVAIKSFFLGRARRFNSVAAFPDGDSAASSVEGMIDFLASYGTPVGWLVLKIALDLYGWHLGLRPGVRLDAGFSGSRR